MRRYYNAAIVVNPRSANGRTGRVWGKLERNVRDALGDYALLFTEYPGHATELVRKALYAGYDRIISVGGDGTHHEVLNGFFEGVDRINPDATMAVLPLGTGSDLARTLRIAKGAEAIPVLRDGDVRPADIGRVTYTRLDGGTDILHFINIAHAGLGGAVADRVNKSTKRFGGFASFLWGILATVATYRGKPIRLAVDDKEYEEVLSDVIVANAEFDGGGIHVAPSARLDSGTFEVFMVRDVNMGQAVMNLHRLYRGRLHERPDLVTYHKARRIEAHAANDVLVTLDGEVPGKLPATFEVLPGALNVVMAA